MLVGEGRDGYVGVGAEEVFVEVEEVGEAAADGGGWAGEGFEIGLWWGSVSVWCRLRSGLCGRIAYMCGD